MADGIDLAVEFAPERQRRLGTEARDRIISAYYAEHPELVRPEAMAGAREFHRTSKVGQVYPGPEALRLLGPEARCWYIAAYHEAHPD
jgi:hypothetical protein